jgi:outer membrane protein OmpA-like peptidoglycan-associated protein
MRASRMHSSAAIAIAVGGALLAACSAAPAQSEGAQAREQARQLEEARDINVEARLNAEALRAQIAELQADNTNRGVVLKLDDGLFGGNTASLNTGGGHRLDKVVDFLNRNPQRNALIEGYDDSAGSHQHDRALPERRADAVKTYLVHKGISSKRLTVKGTDARSPLGDHGSDNASVADRQNRHVEVVIENRLSSPR